MGNSRLRPAAIKSGVSVFRNFFILQYKAALFPARYTVSRADHPLDEKIPFRPDKVTVYLDFLHLFVRTLGFLLVHFRGRALAEIKELIGALGRVYGRAAEVYAKNFSTTARPRYLRKVKFMVIHLFDPHLMCVPSLHVMVVILAYIGLKKILLRLGEEKTCSNELAEVRNSCLAIIEAVLYVKQHSVNCIPAAMYAMTRFEDAFSIAEAESLIENLFKDAPDIAETDVLAIRGRIAGLYQQFCTEGETASSWEEPLLAFLSSLPVHTKAR